MSFFDSIMPDFNDPNTMAAYGALGNVLSVGSAPRYDPRGQGITGGSPLNALLALGGAGMQGATAGASGAQAYQQQNIANQGGQLSLDLQKVSQPYQIGMMKQIMGGDSSAPGSLTGGSLGGSITGLGSGPNGALTQADQLGLQMLQSAKLSYASTRDPKPLMEAYKSLYEHNPALAGAITQNQQFNTYQKTPEGKFVMPSQAGAISATPFGSPAPSMAAAPSVQPMAMDASQITPPNGTPIGSPQSVAPPPSQNQIPNNPFNQQAAVQPNNAQLPREFSVMPPTQQSQPQKVVSTGLASDGKPYVDNADKLNFFKPDPSFTPSLPSAATDQDVDQRKKTFSSIDEGNTKIAASALNANQMNSRLNDIANAYHQAQSGGALSINPDLANQAISAGIIKDPTDIKTVAQYQRVLSDLSVETLNQIKSAAPDSKIMNSELRSIQNKMADPHLQPEAIQDILALSQGLGNYSSDLAKGWNYIGGKGNRVAGGFTMDPETYTSQFASKHSLDDYINQAKASMPSIMGVQNIPPALLAVSHETRAQELTNRGYQNVNGKWIKGTK